MLPTDLSFSKSFNTEHAHLTKTILTWPTNMYTTHTISLEKVRWSYFEEISRISGNHFLPVSLRIDKYSSLSRFRWSSASLRCWKWMHVSNRCNLWISTLWSCYHVRADSIHSQSEYTHLRSKCLQSFGKGRVTLLLSRGSFGCGLPSFVRIFVRIFPPLSVGLHFWLIVHVGLLHHALLLAHVGLFSRHVPLRRHRLWVHL